jgi:hypothetical protein
MRWTYQQITSVTSYTKNCKYFSKIRVKGRSPFVVSCRIITLKYRHFEHVPSP